MRGVGIARWLLVMFVTGGPSLCSQGFSLVPSIQVDSPPRPCRRRQRRSSSSRVSLMASSNQGKVDTNGNVRQHGIKHNSDRHELLIHWKGEGVEGYSAQFRHVEFLGSLAAVLGLPVSFFIADNTRLSFVDALAYDASVELSELKRNSFNSAMQYLETSSSSNSIRDDKEVVLSRECLIQAASRCSLVHALYQVVAEEDAYEDLAPAALQQGGFDDVMVGGRSQYASWCLRVRHYGEMSTDEKATRYGDRARSMTLERTALQSLEPLLGQFGGRVHLEDPDCKIYVFDGLLGQKKVLARRLATGPRISTIAPVTRICITNTPLCPIAAFCLCNVAGVRNDSKILDPYCGSGATLLAASMMEATCRSVGIEIAHDGLVNRHDILQDFVSRQLTPPVALLQGDSTHGPMRRAARHAIGQNHSSPFDLIVTDPPYGIRESTASFNHHQDGAVHTTPLEELFRSIALDRSRGEPLLRPDGGTLVAFVPCVPYEQDLVRDCLPSETDTSRAGLQLVLTREQVLNDKLSRWLVLYTSCQ